MASTSLGALLGGGGHFPEADHTVAFYGRQSRERALDPVFLTVVSHQWLWVSRPRDPAPRTPGEITIRDGGAYF